MKKKVILCIVGMFILLGVMVLVIFSVVWIIGPVVVFVTLLKDYNSMKKEVKSE